MKLMEVTTKKIGGATFYIRPFPAFTTANISGELSRVVGPVIGGLAPMFRGASEDEIANIMNMDLADAIPAISAALANVDGDKLEHLMKRLLITYKTVSVSCEETGNEKQILDLDLANEIFCGDLQDMILLCVEVINLNFKGFFKNLAARYGSLRDNTAPTRGAMNDGETLTSAVSMNLS